MLPHERLWPRLRRGFSAEAAIDLSQNSQRGKQQPEEELASDADNDDGPVAVVVRRGRNTHANVVGVRVSSKVGHSELSGKAPQKRANTTKSGASAAAGNNASSSSTNVLKSSTHSRGSARAKAKASAKSMRKHARARNAKED